MPGTVKINLWHKATNRASSEMLQLGTKPNYYIVPRRSPIIAGLMQVEIMAIISPAEVGDAGAFMSESLCAEVDGSRLVNYTKLWGRISCSAVLHLSLLLHSSSPWLHSNPSTPPFTNSPISLPCTLPRTLGRGLQEPNSAAPEMQQVWGRWHNNNGRSQHGAGGADRAQQRGDAPRQQRRAGARRHL